MSRLLLKKLKIFILCILKPNGKISFLRKINSNAKILDVGCGNNSPIITKGVVPNCFYVGIDVENHNQEINPKQLADLYIVSTPFDFAKEIEKINYSFEVIISTHNLEHCNDREATLKAILNKLKKGGLLYLTFPCEESVNFPSRYGTLNYFDDPTHKNKPPEFKKILSFLKSKDMNIVFTRKNNQPPLMRLIGEVTEPFSKKWKKVLSGTWEKWGFETLIIAQKI